MATEKTKTPKAKPTKAQFLIRAFIGAAILAIFWAMTWTWVFPGDVTVMHSFGAIHIVFNIVYILAWLFLIITLGYEWDADNQGKGLYHKYYRLKNESTYCEEPTKEKPYKFTKWIVLCVLAIVLYYLTLVGLTIFNSSVKLYNQSKKYQNEYTKKVQEKRGFYDKLWKTYYQKDKIVKLNSDMFVKVTKIIMENRKDGQNVSWKWLTENQQIPYDDFVKFYADLSNFITSQREGYFAIEQVCQELANKNNTMLDTFPNNYYNEYITNCKRINFEYGFTSDSTETVFTTKSENVK